MNTLKFVRVSVLALACLAPATAQQTYSPDDIVAVIGGEEYTVRRMEQIRASMPVQFKERTDTMDNRSFVQSYAELKAMAQMAEKEGALEKEPFKSQLEHNKMIFLAQVYLTLMNQSLEVTQEDIRSYYENHKTEHEDVRVSAIYIDYTPIPELAGKAADANLVSEQDAWAKAEKLHAELRGGADFAELAKEHSDDKGTAEKGGDVGFFSPDAQLSDKLKQTIFSLQPDQISSPVKDGGRYYIFKCTERKPKPYEEIGPKMAQMAQSEKLRKKLDQVRSSLPIEYKNEAYLNQKAPPPTAMPSSRPQPSPQAAP